MRAFEEGEIVGVVRGEQRRRAEVADGLPVGEGFDDRARALDIFGIGHPVAIMQFARWRVGGLAIVEEKLHLFACPSIHAASVRRSEEHTSELQSLMRISYAVFCLKKKKKNIQTLNK